MFCANKFIQNNYNNMNNDYKQIFYKQLYLPRFVNNCAQIIIIDAFELMFRKKDK